MGKLIDLTGQKFGKLTVIKRVESRNSKVVWECRCECGNVTYVSSADLRYGHTRSCGCIHSQQIAARNKAAARHGMSRARIYHVWASMKERCQNPKSKDYERYGGRGIKVFQPWSDDFLQFKSWAYSHGYDESANFMACTLDRIDVNGDYCPSNCRFVSAKIQANNRRNSKQNRLMRGDS